jgi:hypothetical protein
MLEVCEEWEDMSNNIDIEGAEQGFWAQEQA